MVKQCIADGEPVHLEPGLGGHELVLHRLADLYCGPDAQGAESAFRAADKDSSGYLDLREMCGVIRVSSVWVWRFAAGLGQIELIQSRPAQ